MTTITVWLLMMVGTVNGGYLGAVQPHMYPTAADCQQMIDNRASVQYEEGGKKHGPRWRCIQTTVLVPK